jgi:hypothetical protein
MLCLKFYFLGYNTVYSLEFNRRFGGTYCLHLQSRRVSQERNEHEDRGDIYRLTFTGLKGIVSHKTELFILNVGGTPDLSIHCNLYFYKKLNQNDFLRKDC